MPTAAYYTLGCKVNQYETEKIRAQLEGIGFATVGFASPADVYIVNSCTVTGSADSKSRRAIRQAVKHNPDAFVIATGCYAELKPTDVAEIEGVDLVVGNDDKDSIAERVLARFPGLKPNGSSRVQPRTRTRAIVKVQDGCSQFCAYCAVPYARSREWSRPISEVVDEISALAGFGYKEVVLTGIRLGSYSHGLAGLIEAAAAIDGIERVRLSSIEVWEITDELLGAMAASPKVCRHLHVPLQSGDAGVLESMRRPYTPQMYAGTVGKARKTLPGLGLTTDVIVGFPGEDTEAFDRSYRFVREVGFSRLHVFRYSARPGTAAVDLPGQVAESDKTARSEMMMARGEELAREFALDLVGKTMPVLAESKRTELLSGFTDNYVEVQFAGDNRLRGSIVPVRIDRVGSGSVEGKIQVTSDES
jgi:threonylcarbamoyladenosine tRNA methylthiotransferase MtaB